MSYSTLGQVAPVAPPEEAAVWHGITYYPSNIRRVAIGAAVIFGLAYLLKDTAFGRLSGEYGEFRRKRGMLPNRRRR